jgi:hypothetical protein
MLFTFPGSSRENAAYWSVGSKLSMQSIPGLPRCPLGHVRVMNGIAPQRVRGPGNWGELWIGLIKPSRVISPPFLERGCCLSTGLDFHHFQLFKESPVTCQRKQPRKEPPGAAWRYFLAAPCRAATSNRRFVFIASRRCFLIPPFYHIVITSY